MDVKTNGDGELERREQEYAKFLAKQTLDRDEAVAESTRLKAQATGLLTKIDVLEAQLANEVSKTQTAMLVRDEAVARRAELEAVLKSIQSVLRAFHISHEPIIKEIPEDDSPTIGGA